MRIVKKYFGWAIQFKQKVYVWQITVVLNNGESITQDYYSPMKKKTRELRSDFLKAHINQIAPNGYQFWTIKFVEVHRYPKICDYFETSFEPWTTTKQKDPLA